MYKNELLVATKIGEIIAKKRKQAGLTQEQVAERLGVGNEAISRIERGKVVPTVLRLYEIAEVFDCGIETFFIEGSGRATDQVEYVLELLAPLSTSDRQLIVGMVEIVAQRLAA